MAQCISICAQDIHGKVSPEEVELVRREYTANGGWETFLSYEDVRQDILIGLLRLRRLPRRESIVRELHVYGSAVAVHLRDASKHQHQVRSCDNSQQYRKCSVCEPRLVVFKQYRLVAVCSIHILQQVSQQMSHVTQIITAAPSSNAHAMFAVADGFGLGPANTSTSPQHEILFRCQTDFTGVGQAAADSPALWELVMLLLQYESLSDIVRQ